MSDDPTPNPDQPTPDASRFVSRAGLKLDHALNHFNLDVAAMVAADLGCSTGGFTDCLLQRGAAQVYSVDTAYGELAWKLRQSKQVIVLERTNVIHFNPFGNNPSDVAASPTTDTKKRRRSRWHDQDQPHPSLKKIPDDFHGVDLVVVDLGWTKQDKALPAARHWLNPDGPGHVITLIKPHYESGRHQLDNEQAMQVAHDVMQDMQRHGWLIHNHCPSPIPGGKGGNLEVLAHLQDERLQHDSDKLR